MKDLSRQQQKENDTCQLPGRILSMVEVELSHLTQCQKNCAVAIELVELVFYFSERR